MTCAEWKNNTVECCSYVLSHCLKGCQGQLCVNVATSPGYTHTHTHTHKGMQRASHCCFTYSCDRLPCRVSIFGTLRWRRFMWRVKRALTRSLPVLLLNTQGHTPAALTRNHPGQQRSSPLATGGVCQSCWPGTMMSHSCWGHESRSS